MDRIELDNLTRTYYDAQGETFCALDHAALIWEQGHSIAIMGESGRYVLPLPNDSAVYKR